MKNEFQRILLIALVGFAAIVALLFKAGMHFSPNFIVYGIVGFLVFWFCTGFAYSYVQYLIKGYSVETTGEHLYRLIYRERHHGSIELFNDACMDDNSHYYFVVTVPTESEWREKMPDWAKERRHEIMQRIMDELKTSDFRYPGYTKD